MTHPGIELKDRILDILHESLTILAGQENSALYQSIVNASERLLEPMQLAIIGKISSSKSTLVNAILGESEVVRTGQMEETFNVSWLKYGNPLSDIKVVFKNGEIAHVPKCDWGNWTSHQAHNRLKKKVKYIEVYHDHEILKEINIIDTPGLDALSQVDSENTIAFLKEVRPDAVVMLFTKSIAESTLTILQDFQNVETSTFNLSALNAIGVLAKVDTMWSAIDPDKDILKDANRVIERTLYDKYPEVRRSLFSILPVSSLMGLAAATIDDNDLRDIIALSRVEINTMLEMLASPDFFLDEEYDVKVSVERRRYLYSKFGLYGIYVLTNIANRNSDISISLLKETLLKKSGFGKLLQTVRAHFGGRATLIKSQAILQNLLREIALAKISFVGEVTQKFCMVESLLVSTMLTMHEYREWEFLSKYYDGKIDLDSRTASEFTALCGENGYSAKERLQCPSATNTSALIEKATSRALYWQKQYNIYSAIEPEMAGLYKVIISSYNQLIKDIRHAEKNYKTALISLEKSASFLGLNEFSSTTS